MSTTDKEFKSQLEEIMPAEELILEMTSAFGLYKAVMPEEAVQHPAKFNTNLVEYLIREYTKPGDVILDPMAGTGVLGVIASLHGRHAIQVELEERFYRWMEKARERVERLALVGMRKGWIKNICGDARCLSELLNQADVAITSPPYLKTAEKGAGINRQREGDVKIGCSTTGRTVTHPEAIDNTKEYGSIDMVITSPPYEHSNHDTLEKRETWKNPLDKHDVRRKKLPVGYSENPENIGNLKSSEEEYEALAKGLMRNDKLTEKGRIVNIHGDARHLSKLLNQVDIAIMSPPFGSSTLAEGLRGRDLSKQKDFLRKQHRDYSEIGSKGDSKNIGYLPLGNIDAVVTSPPFGDTNLSGGDPERRRERLIKAGFDPKDFLGGKARNAVLKHYTEVNTIITSPPYSNVISRQGGPPGVENVGVSTKTAREYSPNPDNIGNLPLGEIDTVITSPPYSESLQSEHNWDAENQRFLEKTKDKKRKGRQWVYARQGDRYSENKNNIGNLPHGNIDTIITSPPYEASLEGSSRHTRGGIASRDPALAQLAQTGTYATVASFGVPICYSPNPENIGNLKSSDKEYEALAKGLMKNGKPTYLSEMLKIYSEMWKVLKPGGKAIIVIKPFIRNKKIIDLPYHTYVLLSYCGFILKKLYKLRLKQQSFWRILYYKKHPDTPLIAHEYIIVVEKA